jgi:Arc/MetJ-type ribon-helix-helix transcriptional regulator
MDPNEKIQLDDITFDDVIAGDGVDTVAIDEVEKPVEKEEVKEEVKDEQPTEDNLEEDAEVEDQEDEQEYEEDDQDEDDDVESSEEDQDTVVSEVLSKLGFETDEAYDDTADGLAQMTKDIASELADDRIDEVLEAFPLVKQHLQYVLNGGESQDFMQAYDPNLDYNQISLAEDDVRSQQAILSDYFTTKGHDKEFIKEMLEDYADSGKLHSKAEAARQALGKVQAQRKEQMVERQKEQMAAQQKQQQEFWDGVSETIQNSNEFAGLQVPEKEKSKFFNYISRPVDKNGYTQRDIDHVEADMETKLAIDYLMYKGFNLNDIINTKAKTKATRSLRDKISKNEDRVKNARRKSRVSKNVDLDNLDLSI